MKRVLKLWLRYAKLTWWHFFVTLMVSAGLFTIALQGAYWRWLCFAAGIGMLVSAATKAP